SGHARRVLDNGDLLSRQRVEKRGFPYIGPSHDSYDRFTHLISPTSLLYENILIQGSRLSDHVRLILQYLPVLVKPLPPGRELRRPGRPPPRCGTYCREAKAVRLKDVPLTA